MREVYRAGWLKKITSDDKKKTFKVCSQILRHIVLSWHTWTKCMVLLSSLDLSLFILVL